MVNLDEVPDGVNKSRAAGFTSLRYPGGSEADRFHWQDWIGPHSPEWITNPIEFYDFAEAIGAEPVITVNFGTGTAQEAAAWVSYNNVDNHAYTRYWEIGNEIYGDWEDSWTHDGTVYMNGDESHDGANSFCSAMKVVDSSIEVGMVGDLSADAQNSFSQKAIQAASDCFDFYIIHYYPFAPSNFDYHGLLGAASADWPAIGENLRALFSQNQNTKNLDIALTEYNSYYTEPPELASETVNMLFLADVLGQAADQGVHLANQHALLTKANLFGARYGLLTDYDGSKAGALQNLTRIPSYYVYPLWRHSGDQLLSSTVNRSNSFELSVYASKTSENGDIALIVINKTGQAQSASINLRNFNPDGRVDIFVAQGKTLDDPEIKYNGNNDPPIDLSTVSPIELGISDSVFSYEFPPYSVTSLTAIENTSDVPVAMLDQIQVQEDSSVLISPLDNDFNFDGSITITSVSTPSHGSVTLTDQATSIIYMPDPDFSGSDTIIYTISDRDGSYATSEILIEVQSVNDLPIARAGPNREAELGAVVELDGSLSSDIDGDLLSYQWSILSAPPGSTSTIASPTSSVTFFVPDVEGDFVLGLSVSDGIFAPVSASFVLTSYLIPSPPDFVSAVGRKGKISLEWSPSANALSYKIYSDTFGQLSTGSQIRTTSATATTYTSFISEDLVSFAVASLRNQRESTWSQVVSTRPILAPISSFSPGHNSTGLALNTSFTIVFDEPIFQINGSAITNPSDLLSISDSTGAFASITASVTTSTTRFTLSPVTDLNVATDYFLTLSPIENANGFETGFKEVQFRTCEGYSIIRIAGSCHGYMVGSNINHWHLDSEAQYATVLAREFSLVVPEVEAKWSYLESTEQNYNYADLDTIHGFAEQNSQETKGHVLLWHSSIPSFVTSAADAGTLTTAQLQAWVDTHIITTLERYRGKIHQWDVVNEAFNDDGTYRDTLFLQKLGAGFISGAHTLALTVDPTLRLLYNDYGIAAINSKSDAVYSMVSQMIESGIPIHGIGMQMHISASNPPNLESVQENIQRFGRLGLEVQISEMDMRISGLSGTTSENLQTQKDLYRQVVGICRVEPNCDTIIFWGFTDKHTWIDGVYGADDPLLFDENYISKPAFDGVTQALKEGLRTDDYASLFSFGGLPLTTSGVPALKILSNIGFKIGYSETRKNPIWTAYRVFQMDNPTTNSYSSYTIDDRTDARVKTGDYTSTGYGRGLLAPQYAIDTRYGLNARKEARKMSNITPQISYLNSHVMDALEDKVAEDFAQDYEEVWVMTGSIFDSNIETLSSGTGVEVPDSFFKIVSDIENGEPRVLAFLVHQTSNDKTNLAQYLVPVDEIEHLTGLDFFWRLPDDLEDALEETAATILWDSIASSPGATASTGPNIDETGDDLGGEFFFAGQPQTTISTETLVILTNTGFTVAYNEVRKNPSYAAYRLFALSNVVTHDRPSSFSKDTRTVAQIVHGDYTNSGYDRGHVAPNYAIDTRFGQTAQVQSFLMSNITPQLPYVNRTIIRLLEEKIAKDYANDFLQVWVVTGTIFERSIETLDSGVEIADAFYKIIVDIEGGAPRLLAFIIPHTANSSDLSLYLTTVDEVEQRTGLDFFTELEDSLENSLESTSPASLW